MRDEEGDPVTVTYQWYVDGEPVEGADGDFLEAGIAVRDMTVQVAVTPNDGYSDGEPVYSNTITVANTPPSAPEIRLGPVPVTFAAKWLAAELIEPATDEDGDEVVYRHTWFRNGSSRFNDPESPTILANVKPGEEWRVQVVPFDGLESGPPVLATTRIPDFVMASPGYILNSHLQSGIESENAAAVTTVSAGAAGADGLAQSTSGMESGAYRVESRYDE